MPTQNTNRLSKFSRSQLPRQRIAASPIRSTLLWFDSKKVALQTNAMVSTAFGFIGIRMNKTSNVLGGLGIPSDRLLALIGVVCWLVFAGYSTGDLAASFLYGGILLAFPLLLIWCSDLLADMVFFSHGSRASTSPGILVRFVGWVFLAGIIYVQATRL